MGVDTAANGQTQNRLTEHTRDGAADPKSTRTRGDAGARPGGPYDKRTRLCLFVPRHIVARLEAHAVAMGKGRDEFAAGLLGKAMESNYPKRDKNLQAAYGVLPQGAMSGDSPPEE
jgi:hypothetical protein